MSSPIRIIIARMIILKRIVPFLFATVLLLAAIPARAQEAPYDEQLNRLAEVLGSVHFLRNLCGERSGTWRHDMQRLLEAENPGPDRRARLIARFNQGYRAFGSTYSSCTDSALTAISRYMQEGEKLAREVVVRYGN